MWRKSLNDSADNPLGAALGPVNNMHYNLTEVADYPGAMPVLIDALKKKGVWFDELSFDDGEITYLNQNVVVLRGTAYEVVHRAFHGGEHGLARKQERQGNLCVSGRPHLARRLYSRALNSVHALCDALKITHKRSLPNDQAETPPNRDVQKPETL